MVVGVGDDADSDADEDAEVSEGSSDPLFARHPWYELK